MNKRHLDAYIRRQTRAAVRYYTDADVKQVAAILAGTGIGTILQQDRRPPHLAANSRRHHHRRSVREELCQHDDSVP